MARKYDSSRRAEAARQTRQRIAEAAFRLHGQGITDFESLAKEADVSLATVRKHYPTREHVFEGCTAHGLSVTPMPDLAQLAAISDAEERAREAVRQVYRTYEHMTGQLWVGYQFREESAVMAATMQQIGVVVEDVARLIVAGWSDLEGERGQVYGATLGFLSPLTHRALRVEAGLPADQVLEATTGAVLNALRSTTANREDAAAVAG